jgi:3-deoxy-D-manno-octulosonic-acid transferase
MGRHLYSLLLLLCTPLLIAHVVRKYRREQQDPLVSHRLGVHVPDQMDGCVWIHACSLGEAKVGVELARSLINHDASLRILMTATTPAGLDVLARSEFASHVFPWDFSWIWSRWLSKLRPRALIVIETELWPNLVAACHRAAIPVILANGRLSDQSVRGYQRFGWVSRPMWSQVSRALMQFEGDAHNAHRLGVPAHAISEVGSIKLDQPAPQISPERAHQISDWKRGNVLVCLMSSHTDDDALFVSWAQQHPECRLLIVPRHPVRGSEIKTLADAQGVHASQVSVEIQDKSQILIGDTFGDMGAYLSESDVIAIGGSFSGKGGQNPIEPALMSKPLIAGPSMHNFQAISIGLEAADALLRTDAQHLSQSIDEALATAHVMGQSASAWVEANRGSTELQVQAILAAIAAR